MGSGRGGAPGVRLPHATAARPLRAHRRDLPGRGRGAPPAAAGDRRRPRLGDARLRGVDHRHPGRPRPGGAPGRCAGRGADPDAGPVGRGSPDHGLGRLPAPAGLLRTPRAVPGARCRTADAGRLRAARARGRRRPLGVRPGGPGLAAPARVSRGARLELVRQRPAPGPGALGGHPQRLLRPGTGRRRSRGRVPRGDGRTGRGGCGLRLAAAERAGAGPARGTPEAGARPARLDRAAGVLDRDAGQVDGRPRGAWRDRVRRQRAPYRRRGGPARPHGPGGPASDGARTEALVPAAAGVGGGGPGPRGELHQPDRAALRPQDPAGPGQGAARDGRGRLPHPRRGRPQRRQAREGGSRDDPDGRARPHPDHHGGRRRPRHRGGSCRRRRARRLRPDEYARARGTLGRHGVRPAPGGRRHRGERRPAPAAGDEEGVPATPVDRGNEARP